MRTMSRTLCAAFVSLAFAACLPAVAAADEYDDAVAQIVAAAEEHAAVVEFEEPVKADTMKEILENSALFGGGERVYTERQTATKIAFDKLGINSIKTYTDIFAKTLRYSRETSTMDLAYWTTDEENTRAEAIVKDVANKAVKSAKKVKLDKKIKNKKKAQAQLKLLQDKQKILYIHDWILDNVAYKDYTSRKWDDIESYGVSADTMNVCSASQLLGHRGQCNSYALTFMRIADEAGLDTRYVLCNGGEHCFIAVWYGSEWLYIDLVNDEDIQNYYYPATGTVALGESGKIKYTYFLKDEAYMVDRGYSFDSSSLKAA